MRSTVLFMMVSVGLLFLTACTGAGVKKGPDTRPATAPLRVGDILDTRQERVISFDRLMEDLSKADVVFVGETHISRQDHQIQKKILQGLFARRASLALAMEMFPREAQGILDRYSRGDLPEPEFVKDIEWDKVWGFPFSLYEPILSWAAERHVPIVGLNAPHEIVRKIARGGLSSLEPDERRRVAATFDLTNSKHRQQLESEFTAHAQGAIRDFEAFYEAQLAWEETMAETLARFLKEHNASRPVVVLIGKGHIEGRFGVPERTVKRASGASYRTVVPVPVDYPDSLSDPNFADFVWITGKTETLPRGSLGVLVRRTQSGEGLEVLAIHPGSPADKAGILTGDVIRAVDGQAVHEIADLHRMVMDSGRPLTIEVVRKTKIIHLRVELLSSP